MLKTEQIRMRLALVDAQQEAVRRVEKALAALKLEAGQTEIYVTVNGVQFQLTRLDRDTGWYPQVRKNMLEIHALAVQMTEAQLAAEKSKLEGLEFAVKQLVKE